MQNKIKRKFLSLMIAVILAVSPLASFPMNVFAGTGKTGVIKAPEMGQQQQLGAVKAELEQVEAQLTMAQGEKGALQQQLDTAQEELKTLASIGAPAPDRRAQTFLKTPGATPSNPVYFTGLCNTNTTKEEVEYRHSTAGSYDELFFNGIKIYHGYWQVHEAIYISSGCGTQSDPYILTWWK